MNAFRSSSLDFINLSIRFLLSLKFPDSSWPEVSFSNLSSACWICMLTLMPEMDCAAPWWQHIIDVLDFFCRKDRHWAQTEWAHDKLNGMALWGWNHFEHAAHLNSCRLYMFILTNISIFWIMTQMQKFRLMCWIRLNNKWSFLVHPEECWKSWLAWILIELLVFIGYLRSQWRRILTHLVIKPASHLELYSFTITHSQSSNPSQASSCSFSIADYLSLIIMKSLYFL